MKKLLLLVSILLILGIALKNIDFKFVRFDVEDVKSIKVTINNETYNIDDKDKINEIYNLMASKKPSIVIEDKYGDCDRKVIEFDLGDRKQTYYTPESMNKIYKTTPGSVTLEITINDFRDIIENNPRK